MIQNIYMPARVVYGKGALNENSALLKELGSRCLVVTGAGSAKLSGALDDALSALNSQNIEYKIYNGITANPLLSSCHEAGKTASDFNADFIFAIGGGSVLDSAKAIAIYAANPDLEPLDIYKRVYKNSPLRTALVGTTAGTGSEVTGVSVLTDDSTGRKKSISGADCYSAISFCDPSYTYSMPYGTTVSTALDAFAHATEGFFTTKCTGTVKLWAKQCIPALFNALCCFYETRALPDEKMRDEIYLGSIYAGLVINTCGTAFPHPLGYVLTENYDIPHGAACAAFFPDFLDRAFMYAPELADEFCTLCGEDAETVKQVVFSLADIKIKISPEEAKAFSERWSTAVPKNFTASPGGLTQEEAARILAKL